MNVKVMIKPRLEDGGFRVYSLLDSGYPDKSIDIKEEELPTLVQELCSSEDGLLEMLRESYQLFDPTSITFIDKEEVR